MKSTQATPKYTSEFLRLGNQILRAFPGSPRQKALQAKRDAMVREGRHIKPAA